MASMSMRWIGLVLVLLTAAAHAADAPAGYSVETIELPEGVRFHIGGVGFTADGAVMVCTRKGDVWRYEDGHWLRFASGLHEPVGLHVDRESGHVFVIQRPELTELIDGDGDGRAEIYRTVCDVWGISGNYHEYAFGLPRDQQGNFYGTLNLAHAKGVGGAIMGRRAKWRGWSFKVTPEGEFVPLSYGLRSPAGIGLGPDGELFYTDNQGDWNPSSSLHRIVEGRFHGHPSSRKDHPKFQDKNLEKISAEQYDKMRKRPAVYFPHRGVAGSPGNPAFDTTGGKFGPFGGQAFVPDQKRSNVSRVQLEKIAGQYQGSVVRFVGGLASGAVRAAFAPDGSLWVGQTSRGWGSRGGRPFALQRITWDGQTVPLAIERISLTADGFAVRFTKPVAEGPATDAANYQVTHWHYKYSSSYGSKRKDVEKLKPNAASMSADGKTVRLKLPLKPERIYQIRTKNLVAAEGGAKLGRYEGVGWYTLNRLRE